MKYEGTMKPSELVKTDNKELEGILLMAIDVKNAFLNFEEDYTSLFTEIDRLRNELQDLHITLGKKVQENETLTKRNQYLSNELNFYRNNEGD